MHRDTERIKSETIAITQDLGEENIWLEKFKISTTPTYDLQELSDRDPLTKLVLETLNTASGENIQLPKDITDMIGILPADIKPEVETDLSEESRGELIDDIRSIIVQALETSGGDE